MCTSLLCLLLKDLQCALLELACPKSTGGTELSRPDTYAETHVLHMAEARCHLSVVGNDMYDMAAC